MKDKNGNKVLGSFRFGKVATSFEKFLIWLGCFLGIILFLLMTAYIIFWAESLQDRSSAFLFSIVFVCASIFFCYIIGQNNKNKKLINCCLKDCIVLVGYTSVIKRAWNGNVKLKLEFQYLSEAVSIESKYIRIDEEILNTNITFLYSKNNHEILFISQESSPINGLI